MFYVEASPAGGYRIMLGGHDAPVSRHDTEEEALVRLQGYVRGLTAPAGRPGPEAQAPERW
jgi:hypothetical protein